MSTIGRTIKNVLKTGPKDALHQMNYIGDTKWGALIGTDRFGNKYFENNDEISGQWQKKETSGTFIRTHTHSIKRFSISYYQVVNAGLILQVSILMQLISIPHGNITRWKYIIDMYW